MVLEISKSILWLGPRTGQRPGTTVPHLNTVARLKHIYTSADPEHRAIWVVLDYSGIPCFSVDVVKELCQTQRLVAQQLRSEFESDPDSRTLFQVAASDHPGTFSLGGDLAYFLDCIQRGDRAALMDYARSCVDAQVNTARHYELPVTTLSVVEGECLGGGFECALSSSVLIADETSRFAFPELTFGMFPGMGALALLLRKVAPAVARRVILDQAVYTAAELHELGIVDIVTSAGKARDAARTYMRENIKRHAGLHGLQVAMDHALPINGEEFTAVVDEWVDTAFRLSESNRRLMDYLARGQQRRHSERVEDRVNLLRRPFA